MKALRKGTVLRMGAVCAVLAMMGVVFPSAGQSVPSVFSGPLSFLVTRSLADKLVGVLLICPSLIMLLAFVIKPTKLSAAAAVAGVLLWLLWGLMAAACAAA